MEVHELMAKGDVYILEVDQANAVQKVTLDETQEWDHVEMELGAERGKQLAREYNDMKKEHMKTWEWIQ